MLVTPSSAFEAPVPGTEYRVWNSVEPDRMTIDGVGTEAAS